MESIPREDMKWGVLIAENAIVTRIVKVLGSFFFFQFFLECVYF
jgi:hypothetical protein